MYGTSQLGAAIPPFTLIPRNSPTGYWLRLKARIKLLLAPDSRLRYFIIELLRTRDEVIARLTGAGRIRRVFAYAGLRYRKWRRAGFAAHGGPQQGPLVDIVIPTIGKDQRLLQAYLDRLRSHLYENIGTVFIVAPTTDTTLHDFARENHATLIDERTVLGYGKEKIEYYVGGLDRRGWLFQQLLKLSGDQFVTASEYIIVDSDTLLTQPYRFHTSDGKTILFESTEWHPPYFEAFKKLFGYDAPHPLSLTSHMMLFSCERLALMKAEIRARHGLPWDEAYRTACDTTNNSGISDYDTYGQWLLKNFPEDTITLPLYNQSFARHRFGNLLDLEAATKNRYTSLSFHSYN
jgi:hypothetical protein